ncbi:MAG: hypothetical protein ACK495_16565, partial [Bradyrhizobium sp.]
MADPLDDVMGGLMRDARSSFARMVPLDLVPAMPSLQPPAIQHPSAPPASRWAVGAAAVARPPAARWGVGLQEVAATASRERGRAA